MYHRIVFLCLFSMITSVHGKTKFLPLTEDCEEALALSALPKHLRSQANVHILKDNKFIKTIKSKGGYHCLVVRNHAESIIPQCVTPSGAKDILPALKYRTLMTLKGYSSLEVDKLFDQAVIDKKFAAPEKVGINYMMSAYNHIYIEQSNVFRDVGPHVMIFAPNVTNEDVGGSMQMAMKNTGYPSVIESGVHGYIVSMVEQASDSQDVINACNGQLTK